MFPNWSAFAFRSDYNLIMCNRGTGKQRVFLIMLCLRFPAECADCRIDENYQPKLRQLVYSRKPYLSIDKKSSILQVTRSHRQKWHMLQLHVYRGMYKWLVSTINSGGERQSNNVGGNRYLWWQKTVAQNEVSHVCISLKHNNSQSINLISKLCEWNTRVTSNGHAWNMFECACKSLRKMSRNIDDAPPAWTLQISTVRFWTPMKVPNFFSLGLLYSIVNFMINVDIEIFGRIHKFIHIDLFWFTRESLHQKNMVHLQENRIQYTGWLVFAKRQNSK